MSIIIGVIFGILIIVLLLLLIIQSKALERERSARERIEEKCEEIEFAYEEEKLFNKELSGQYEDAKKTKKLAFLDVLTDLPNKNALLDKLESFFSSLRKDENFGIMYIDLDNFKYINDRLGHSYGDELLMDVANRIKQLLENEDYLVRYGGDEFMILSEQIHDIGDYEEKVKRIQKVFSFPFSLAMQEFSITTSIGIAIAPRDGKNIQTLLKNVDIAMYTAKKMGRNTYCFFDDSFNQILLTRMEIQSDLYSALEQGEMEVYYQPVVSVKDNRICGLEALLRWNHPIKGRLLPESFLNIAEDTGVIKQLGTYLIKNACEQLKKWEKKGCRRVSLCINLTSRQFHDKELISTLRDSLNMYEIDPKYIELDISEEVINESMEYAKERLKKLKELGVLISLDDFGFMHASLNQIRFLPLDQVKLDNDFVYATLDQEDQKEIMDAFIKFAKTLHLTVVAEGVEYQEQADFLRKCLCDKLQGFLYYDPMPAKEIEILLK